MQFVRSRISIESSELDVVFLDTTSLDMGPGMTRYANPAILVSDFAFNLNALHFHTSGLACHNSLLRPVNEFMKTLTAKEAKLLGLFYIAAWRTISDVPPLADVVRLLSSQCYNFAQSFDLSSRLVKFIGSWSSCLTAANKITADVAWRLLTIGLLSKLLQPVFGELLYQYQHIISTQDTALQAVTCFQLIDPILLLPEFTARRGMLMRDVGRIAHDTHPRHSLLSTKSAGGKALRTEILAKLIVQHYGKIDFYKPQFDILLETQEAQHNLCVEAWRARDEFHQIPVGAKRFDSNNSDLGI